MSSRFISVLIHLIDTSLFLTILLKQVYSSRPASINPYGGMYQGQNTSITSPKCSFCVTNRAA